MNRFFCASACRLAAKNKLSAAPCIGFNLTAEQKEYQNLARKFTREEIIPKVYFRLQTQFLSHYCVLESSHDEFSFCVGPFNFIDLTTSLSFSSAQTFHPHLPIYPRWILSDVSSFFHFLCVWTVWWVRVWWVRGVVDGGILFSLAWRKFTSNYISFATDSSTFVFLS